MLVTARSACRSSAAVVALSARHRLPAIFDAREFADAGALLSYGPNIDATVEFRGDFLYISRAGTNETLAAWPAGSIVQIEPPDPDGVVTYGRRSDLEVLLTDDPATIATLGQHFKPEAKWTRRRWSASSAATKQQSGR